MGEDAPTVADLPRNLTPRSSAGTPSRRALEPASQLPGPELVLRTAEIEQTRRTAIIGVLFNTLGIVGLPLLVADTTTSRLLVAALALAWVNNAWLWFVTSRPGLYDEKKLLVYYSVAPVFNAAIIYYVGVFGPILVMFVLNVYTTCLGYNRRVALVALIGSLAPFAIVALLITLHWIDDVGLMTASRSVGTAALVVITLAFSAFLCMIYAQARATRELMVASLVERDEAVRRASHREALFLEARQDLERALRAGGLGRFTDQTLGSFKLGAVLGRGGMGEVYEATHVASGEPAAVKMLLPEVLGRPTYVRRFLREVQIAAAIESPHVVRVIEVGDEAAALPYLAMERLYGEDLAQILRREGRLSHAAVVTLLRDVARGLGAAATAGIVHRDLKPPNLFLAQGNPVVWKILDFGVSKLVEAGSTLTDNEAVGTPHYMAPEQARGGEVGPPADLYALGAIGYRALTGHQPFQGKTVGEILLLTMSTMPIRPSALARLPRDVDLALAVAMAKNPADRFDSADRMAAAVAAALSGHLDDAVRERATKLLAATPWSEPA